MKKITVLIPFLSLGFIFSCNPKSELLTESEWNEAIENIVHVKKNNVLNYKVEGDLRKYRTNSTSFYDTIKYIEINEKEHVSRRHEEKYSNKYSTSFEKISEYDFNSLKLDEYYDLYGVHRVNHLIKTEKTYTLFEFHISDRIDVFDKILDLYGNYKYFNFINNHYICKSEGVGYHFNVDITFTNKKINTLDIDYLLEEGGEGIAINGDLTFTYGTSKLAKKDLPSDYNDLLDKKMDEVSIVESLVDGKTEIAHQKSITSDVNLFKITCDTDECSKLEISYNETKSDPPEVIYPFSYLKKSTAILKDGENYTILNRGNQVGEGDYWYDNAEPTIELTYEKMVFKKPLQKDQILYLAYEGATGHHSPSSYAHLIYAGE